jgi:hypothetical protein
LHEYLKFIKLREILGSGCGHYKELYVMECDAVKSEVPDQWKESIIVPVHKKGDKTDCNNYLGISLLSTSYTILPNILLSLLSP